MAFAAFNLASPRRTPLFMAGVSAIALSGIASAAAEAASCPVPTAIQTKSVALTIPAGVNPPVDRYETLIQIGKGSPRPVVLDTGSIGLVINKSALGSAYDDSQPPAAMLYTSSGDYEWGHAVSTPVNFVDTDGKVIASSNPVTVTAVECVCGTAANATGGPIPPVTSTQAKGCAGLDGIATTQSGRNVTLQQCKPQAENATGWMGIGFGRGQGGIGNNGVGLADNPMVNIAVPLADAGSYHQGYIFAGRTVTLGLTAENTRGYSAATLTDNAAPNKHWAEAVLDVSITPASGEPPVKLPAGSLLMDTGIDYMFLTVPSAPTHLVVSSGVPVDGAVRNIVPAGATISPSVVAGAGDPAAVFGYRFHAAAPRDSALVPPPAPSDSIGVWAHAADDQHTAYNTGRRLLFFANYLFDYDSGCVGFQPLTK